MEEATAAVAMTVAARHERAVERGRLGGLARQAKARAARGATNGGGQMLTTAQAGTLLGLSKRSILELIWAKRLEAVAQGGGKKRPRRFLIPAAAVLTQMGVPAAGGRAEPTETFRIKVTRLRGKRPIGCRRIIVARSQANPNLMAVVGAVRKAVGAAA